MKTGGPTAVSETRQTLHTLQPAATNKENLVGAGRVLRSTAPMKGVHQDETSVSTQKIELTKKDLTKKDLTKKEVPKKDNKKTQKLTHKDKVWQAPRGSGKIKIEVDDLTSEAGPSENYWQVLAERRRIALDDALDENKELNERVAKLEEENRVCKEMLDETRALVEVLQEMIGEDRSDINNSLDDSGL